MNGILLFNKPILWTSHDCVDFVRRRIGQRSVGHGGTLDPMAVGLLLILIGESTKKFELLSGEDKDYRGQMTLGVATRTQDMEGSIESVREWEGLSRNDVEKAFGQMEGTHEQSPPAFSAAKKNGKKLYEWARQGVIVEAKKKEITIHYCRVIHMELPEVSFELSCSKGTYVRTICHTIGETLGCGGCLSALNRTRIGSYSVDNAVSANQLSAMTLMDLEKLLVS